MICGIKPVFMLLHVILHPFDHPPQSQIVAFGGTAGENDFFRIKMEKSGQFLPGGFHCLPGNLAVSVHGGGITEKLGPVRSHSFSDFWRHWRGGRVVQINFSHILN
jgi:hypothetical protein